MAKDRDFKLHNGKVGSAITVHITPRSSQDKIKEVLKDGTIHVHLRSATADQAMNQSLVELLSLVLGINQGDIDIIAGESGLDKLVTLLNIDPDTVQAKITKHAL